MDNNIESTNNQINNEEFITELVKQIALDEREISEKNQIIRDIYSSQSWKLAIKIEKIFNKVAPPSSYRFQFSRWFFHSCLFIYQRIMLKNLLYFLHFTSDPLLFIPIRLLIVLYHANSDKRLTC